MKCGIFDFVTSLERSKQETLLNMGHVFVAVMTVKFKYLVHV